MVGGRVLNEETKDVSICGKLNGLTDLRVKEGKIQEWIRGGRNVLKEEWIEV